MKKYKFYRNASCFIFKNILNNLRKFVLIQNNITFILSKINLFLMKKHIALWTVSLVFMSVCLFSCKKNSEPTCYCSYMNGTAESHSMKDMTDNQQWDYCHALDAQADSLSGDCVIKK